MPLNITLLASFWGALRQHAQVQFENFDISVLKFCSPTLVFEGSAARHKLRIKVIDLCRY